MNPIHPSLQYMYSSVLDHLDVGIRIIDADEQIVAYNQKMKSIESMTTEDFSEKKIRDVFSFKNDIDSRLWKALHQKESVKNEKQTYYNNKGREVTTINHTFPILYQGDIIAAAEIAKDITQLEKLRRDNKNRGQRSAAFDFSQLIGRSAKMTEVVDNAKRSSRTSSSILIAGETGTGKELFAQSIHTESARTGPFVAQNCAALPDSLIESLLFGTAKGAFTGALERPGLFEEADQGTLLLDEINSLPISLQPKLLRVLQEKKVTRIGGSTERTVDVRVIATINEDPIEAVASGVMRKDLYYRLSVVPIIIPPLRERPEDIEPLIQHFINKYNLLFQMNVENVAEAVMDKFIKYNWPGNVRELEHVVEGAMNFLTGEKTIQAAHIPAAFQHRASISGEIPVTASAARDETISMKEQLESIEKSWIKEALQHHHYNVQQTARKLGLSRQSLQYRMEKLHISKHL